MNTYDPELLDSPLGQAVVDLEAKAKLEAGKSHATQAAQELREAAILKAREVRASTMQKAGEARRKVEISIQDARSRCEAKTRENPVQSLLVAFGAGILVGLILRR